MDLNLFIGVFLLFSIQSCQGYDLSHNKVKAEIRKHLLKDYDKIIGPVKYGNTQYLEVQFRLSITNLVEVNTKEQNLKIDAWVWQRWYDEFLAWNSTNFKKIGYTVFSSKEIWVPDIALINNADRTEKLAGGPLKFVTNVNAYRKGSVTWLSPATFSSTCVQNVKTWPMDTQECTLIFGSCTYPKKNLVIVPVIKSYDTGSVSNGEWTIDNIKVYNDTTDHQNCCGKTYSTVNYKLTLSRKPDYFMFYLAPPAVILVVLALISFFIPTESGERIGFVTTILLTLMVFLLMIPEYLPRTSDQLPILGILMIFAMVVISSALVATIVVLMCYYKDGTPSGFVKKILFPLKGRSKVKVTKVKQIGQQNGAFEMPDKEAADKNKTEKDAMSTIMAPDRNEEITWPQVAAKLNLVFFWFICVISVVVVLVLLLHNTKT